MKSFLLLCVLCPVISFSQQYQPLQAEGTIPKEFVTKSSEKYLEEKQNFAKSEEKQTQKIKNAFYLKSTFSLDNLLKSGYVLFNDPVSDYVNRVAQEVMKANPQIKTDIRFYTLKSTAVNALSTNSGVVLINLGLIAQLENEAQLAFILCHEISHILEKHAIDNYIHVEHVSKGKGMYKKLTFDEKVVEHMRYSKENEEEADIRGFELFANTKYSFNELDGTFDVLKYSHLPIDDIAFNYALLESDNLVFPADYKITEVNPIKTESDEDEDDEKSSHPSIDKRRKAIKDAVKGKANEGRVPFVISESEFKAVRALARNELMRLYVANRDYETAVYHAAILLKEDPSQQFVEDALGRALYGLAFYAGGNFYEVHTKADKTEGYFHQTALLFEKLGKKPQEVAIVALHYMLALQKKYPDNPSNEYYINRLVKLLVNKYELDWDYFVSETLADAKKKAEEEEAAAKADTVRKENESLTKYEKIKAQSTTEEAVVEHYSKYALAAYKSDTKLWDIFKKYEQQEEEKTFTSNQKKAIARRGYALNIDKVLVFDPIYALVDEKKKESYRYLESEKGQESFAASIEDISKKLDLEITVMNAGNFKPNDIEGFNDFAFLNEYINERLRHPEELDISTIERDRILNFTKKHGTKFVNLSALIYLKQKSRLGFLIFGSIIYPIVLPYTIPRMVSNGKNCYYLDLLYNLETDRLVFSEAYNINAPDREHLINSHLYHTLHQIKSDKKLKP